MKNKLVLLFSTMVVLATASGASALMNRAGNDRISAPPASVRGLNSDAPSNTEEMLANRNVIMGLGGESDGPYGERQRGSLHPCEIQPRLRSRATVVAGATVVLVPAAAPAAEVPANMASRRPPMPLITCTTPLPCVSAVAKASRSCAS